MNTKASEKKQAKFFEGDLPFKAIIDNMNEGLIIVDLDNTILFINNRLCEMLGYEKSELLGKIGYKILRPKSEWDLVQTKNQIRKKGISDKYEATMIKKSGELVNIEISGVPLKDDKGEVIGSFGIITDITPRKKIQEDLIKSEKKYRNLVENAPVALSRVVMDKSGFEYINKELESQSGFTLDEFNSFKPEEMSNRIHREDKDRITDAYREWMKNNYEGVFKTDYRVKRKNGEYVWLDCYFYAEFDEEKNLHAINQIYIDITEQKKNEEKISLLADALESSSDLITITDIENNFIFVNKPLLRRYGYEESELIGKNPSIFSLNGENVELIKEIYKTTLSGGWQGELINITKGGEIFPVSLSTSVIRDNKGNAIGLIGVARDITEQKKAFKELEKRNREINLLYEAGKILSSSLEFQQLYENIYQIVTQAIPCDEMFVSSYDEENKLIKYVFLRDKRGEVPIDTSNIPPIPLAPKGKGIQSAAIHTGESLLINDYVEKASAATKKFIISHSGELMDKSLEEEHVQKSALIIPIKLKNKVLGVLQIFSFNSDVYTPEHLKFAETLMHQVALATNNAILYDKAQKEIDLRKKSEETILSSFKEKELLLKEIYHRVKNNLQVVSSLLKLQSEQVKNTEYYKYFKDSQTRVKSIALIHEKLYRASNLSNIDFGNYIDSLLTHLFSVYDINRQKIKFNINAEDINLSIESAIPCGLLINELVSNSLKHAFKEDMEGEVTIDMCYESDGDIILKVKDNGPGLPKGTDILTAQSMGLQLIVTLTEQLQGSFQHNNSSGCEYIFKFKPSEYKNRLE